MMFIILTQDNQSTLSSFSLFLRFVTNIPVAEKALSGSTDMGLIVIKPWNSFSRLFALFSVASKRLISFFTICDWISSYAGIVSWPSLSVRARLRGATGAIVPGSLLQGGPRDDIYLFWIKYSFEKLSWFKRGTRIHTTEYKYFRFCSMQIYLNFAWNFSQ